MTSNLRKLPFLPGYNIDTRSHSQKKYHRKQAFSVENGIPVNYSENRNISRTITSSDTTDTMNIPNTFETTSKLNSIKADVDQAILPRFVTMDRKVLRFYSYFKEIFNDSPDEPFRIRKCIIYYYLADDTIHISEPKIENSGVPQGTFYQDIK